ncbi:MAG: hypothetical protein ACRD59_14275 [Candidatus Acidiferrales bacterium]
MSRWKPNPHRHKWDIRRTIWPYNPGWGTFCVRCKTVLDTGLTREEAERRRDELNSKAAA